MRLIALAVAIAMLLPLLACERKGSNPPRPMTSLQALAAVR